MVIYMYRNPTLINAVLGHYGTLHVVKYELNIKKYSKLSKVANLSRNAINIAECDYSF